MKLVPFSVTISEISGESCRQVSKHTYDAFLFYITTFPRLKVHLSVAMINNFSVAMFTLTNTKRQQRIDLGVKRGQCIRFVVRELDLYSAFLA